MNHSDAENLASAGRVSAGEMLRRARESQQLSCSEVAVRLRLAVRQIEALEDDQFDRLPGATFARGFIRNYARLLQLDPEQVLAAADLPAAAEPAAAARSHIAVPDQNIRISSADRARNQAMLAWGTVLLVLAGFGAALWHWEVPLADMSRRLAHRPAGETGNPPPTLRQGEVADLRLEAAPAIGVARATQEQEPAATGTPPVGAPAPEALPATPAVDPAAAATPPLDPAAGANRLKFTFSGESWVEVRDAQGKKVYSRLNQAGSEQEIEAAPPLTLVIGNAPSVKLTFNGHDVDLLPHTKVTVARLTLEQ